MAVTEESRQHVLVVCEKGYGKRTNLEEVRQQNRGGKGIILIDRLRYRARDEQGVAEVARPARRLHVCGLLALDVEHGGKSASMIVAISGVSSARSTRESLDDASVLGGDGTIATPERGAESSPSAAQLSMANRRTNWLPFPNSLSTDSVPPSPSASPRQIARPSPVPRRDETAAHEST